MTKFEEEVDKVAKQVGYESLSLLIGDCEEANKIYIHFKNWHSDEQFQKLLEQNADWSQECKNINQINSQLTKENKDLKSQLQQQALPVVPECVGEFIEDCKKEGDCLFGVFADATRVEHDMPDLVYFWLGDEGNNDESFARAWLDGYTVEKPQLFYLKNILTTSYLILNTSTGYFEHWASTEATGRYKSEFTKAEIASMHAESYEQIEVVE